MKKIALTLLTIFSLFVISCEIGLGASVDTDPPSIDIVTPQVDTIIRDNFAIGGTWSDDGTIASVIVKLERTDGYGSPIDNLKANFTLPEKGETEGSWSYIIKPVEDNIIDGPYQATVTISDTTGRKTIQTRTFTIDNTAPIVVLQRPSSVIGSAESDTDTYGQILSLVGQAADDNNINTIDVNFYLDSECTTLVNTVTLSNIPATINLDVAKFIDNTENDYSKIYGFTEKKGSVTRYCKIIAYDGAQKYPTDGSNQSAEDTRGNKQEIYYLYDDISADILSNHKITELYSMFNGTFAYTVASRASEDIDIDAIKTSLAAKQNSKGKFNLNPANNPTFLLSGRPGLKKDGTDFFSASNPTTDNNITTDSTAIIEVSPGLDGISLNGDSIKVYILECNQYGAPLDEVKFYPITTKSKSGTGYKFVSTITNQFESVDGTKKLTLGKYYLFGVEGTDQKGNPIVPNSTGGYGFYFAASGAAPTITPKLEISADGINWTEITDQVSYLPAGTQVKVSGTVSVENGTPDFSLKLDSTDAGIVFTEKTEAPFEYSFSKVYEASAFGTQSGQHGIKITAIQGGGKTEKSYTIMYDLEPPIVSEPEIKPIAYKYIGETRENDGKKYLNGNNVSIKVSISDKYDVVDSTTNPAIIEILDKDGNVVRSSGNITTPANYTWNNINTNGIAAGDITIRITAYDRAGNKQVYEENGYSVDQNTDNPVIIPGNNDKLTFTILTTDGLSGQQKNFFTSGSSMVVTLLDDDGVKNVKAILQKADGSGDPVEEEQNYTPDTGTEQTYTYNIPVISAADYYKLKFEVTDRYGIKSSTKEFVIKIKVGTPVIQNIQSVVKKADGTALSTNYTNGVQGDTANYFENKLSVKSGYDSYKVYRSEDDGSWTLVDSNQTGVTYSDKVRPAGIADSTTSVNYKYKIAGVDEDGETDSNIMETTCWIDRITPEITISTPKDNNSNTGTKAINEDTFTFAGAIKNETVNPSGVYYCINQSSEAPSKTSSDYTLLDESDFGTKSWELTKNLSLGKDWYIHVYVVDTAGNISSSTSRKFDVDKENPKLETKFKDSTLSVDSNLTDTNNTQVSPAISTKTDFTIKYSATDDLALDSTPYTVEIRKGDSTIPLSTSEYTDTVAGGVHVITLNTPEDELYTYKITARDSVGKTETKTRYVRLDTKGPVLSTTTIFEGYQENSSVSVKGTSEDVSGVLAVYYSYGATNEPDIPSADNTKTDAAWTTNGWAKYSGPVANWTITVSGQDADSKNLFIRAVDVNGNVSENGISGTLKFDLEVPNLTETTLGTSALPKNSMVILSGKVWDTNGLKGLKVSEGNKEYTLKTPAEVSSLPGFTTESSSNNWTVEFPVGTSNSSEGNYLSEGTHTLTITATDNANKPKTITREVTVDTEKPSSFVLTALPTKDDTLGTQMTLRGTSSDATSGIQKIEVTITDTTDSTKTATGIATGTNSWVYALNFTSEEAAANWKNVFATQGNKKITLKATDAAGNYTTSYKIGTSATPVTEETFIYDKENPVLNVTENTISQYMPANGFTISGTAFDSYKLADSNALKIEQTYNPVSGSSVTMSNYITSVNGKNSEENWTQHVPLSGTPQEGTYTYTFTLLDSIGHQVTSKTYTTTVDTVAPNITDVKISNEIYTASKWYKSQTLSLEVKAEEIGQSGLNMIEYSTNSLTDETKTWTALTYDTETSSYKGPVEFTASSNNLIIRASDKAGNFKYFNGETENGTTTLSGITIRIDTSAPVLSTKFYQVGNKSAAVVSNTIYVNNIVDASTTEKVILYGVYYDTDSGVQPLTLTGYIPKSGTDVTFAYSTTDISNLEAENLSSISFSTLPADTTNIKAWKAEFTPTGETTNQLVISGNNKASISASVGQTMVRDVTKPSLPTFSFEEDDGTEHNTVYKNSSGIYFTNNDGKTYNLSGTAFDLFGLVSVEISGDISGLSDSAKKDTDSPEDWNFSGFSMSGDDNASKSITVTLTDKAGNSFDKEYSIKLDKQPPFAVHELDASEKSDHTPMPKDLYFRIGSQNRDDGVEKDENDEVVLDDEGNATAITAAPMNAPEWNIALDKDVGAKYSNETYGNDTSIEIRGRFEDSGSDVKEIYYKIFGTDQTGMNIDSLKTLVLDAPNGSFNLREESNKRVFYTKSDTMPDGDTNTNKINTGTDANPKYKYYKNIKTNFREKLTGFNEGNNFLVLVAVDNVGNSSVDAVTIGDGASAVTYPNFSLNIDRNAPTLTTNTTETLYTNATSGKTIELSGTVSDDDTGAGVKKVVILHPIEKESDGITPKEIKASLSGANWSYSLDATVLAGATGTTSIYAKAYDKAGSGNWTKVEVARVVVDTTFPEISLDSPADADEESSVAGTQVNKTIKLTGSASDKIGTNPNNKFTVTKLQYKMTKNAEGTSVTNNWADITTTLMPDFRIISSESFTITGFDTTKLTDKATYELRAVVEDSAENTKESDSVEVIIDQDSDRPKINLSNLTLQESGTSYLKSTSTLYLSVTDDDGVQSVKYKIDNGSQKTLTGSSIMITGEGAHTIEFEVTDKAGTTFTSSSTTTPTPKITDGTTTRTGNLLFNVVTIAPAVKDIQFRVFNAKETDTTKQWSEWTSNAGTVGGSKYTKIQIRLTASSAQSVASATASYAGTVYTLACPQSHNDADEHIWTSGDIPVGTTLNDKQTISLSVKDAVPDPMENTSSVEIKLDNIAPTIDITEPASLIGQDATIHGEVSEIVTMFYAVSRYCRLKADGTPNEESVYTDSQVTPEDSVKKDGTTVLATKWEELVREDTGTKWYVYFDDKYKAGSTTEFEPDHTAKLGTYLTEDYLGITTKAKIAATTNPYESKTPVYFWIKAVDSCGNEKIEKQLLNIDPQGERPIVEISYPADNEVLGGAIRMTGTATDNNTARYVWIQIDKDGTEGFSQSELAFLKEKGYKIGKISTNTVLNSAPTNLGNGANAASDYGIMVEVKGTGWSQTINSEGEFNKNGEIATLKITVFATDADATPHKSLPAKKTVGIDSRKPYVEQSSLELVQYDSSGNITSRKPYASDARISGIWYLIGNIKDDDSGIAEIKHNGVARIASTGASYTSGTDSNYKFIAESKTITDDGGSPKTIYNYSFSIPLGNTTENSVGTDEARFEITEAVQSGATTIDPSYSILFDNKAPVLTTDNSDSTITLERNVQNSNGFYTFGAKASEDKVDDVEQSGVERIAFYFTRDLEYGLKDLDSQTYSSHSEGTGAKTHDLFDVMIYHKNTDTDDVESGNMIIDYQTESSTWKKENGLYWYAISGTVSNKTFTYTGTAKKNIHKNGLAKINGSIYLIDDIADTIITLDGAPGDTPNGETTEALFAVCNVIDHSDKNGSTKISTPGYGYGYYDARAKDDGDLFTESFSKQGADWYFDAAINSKNLPDGPITLHMVAFDKAGNYAEWNSSALDFVVSNNAPRIAGMQIGTDENGNGSVDGVELISKYSEIYSLGYDDSGYEMTEVTLPVQTGTTPKAAVTVKGHTVVMPELVGGNGKIKYTYKVYKHISEQSWENSPEYSVSTPVEIATGTTDAVAELTAKIELPVSDFIGKTNNSDTKQIDDGNYKKFEFSFGDSTPGKTKTAGTSNNATLNVIMNVALRENNKAQNWILPFYWKSVSDNSLFGQSKDNGHIELSSDWVTVDAYDADIGEYDADPKVSGKIKLEGIARDDTLLRDIKVKFDTAMSTTGGIGTSDVTIASYNYSTGKWGLASGNSFTPFGDTEPTEIPASGWVSYVRQATYGDLLVAKIISEIPEDIEETAKIKETSQDYGHVVHWLLYIDTSKITGVVATDVTVTATANDRGRPTWNETEGKPSYTTNGTEITVTQGGLSGNYRMDIVPYVTEVTRKASFNTNRARSGAVSLLRGETENLISGFNLTNEDNTSIKIFPDKAATGTETAEMESVAVSGSGLSFKVPADAKSGYLSVVVNNVAALNNINAYKAYNTETNAKAYDHNELTDDRYVHIWRVSQQDTFKGSKNAVYPAMARGSDGTLYASFTNYGQSKTYYTKSFIGTGTVTVSEFNGRSGNNAYNYQANDAIQTTTNNGANGVATIFWGYDPPEETDISVDSNGNVNVFYAANYHGGSNTAWGGTDATQAGGIYVYDTNATSTLINSNGTSSKYAKMYRSELYTYDDELNQFKNIRITRNGNYIYLAYYDRLRGSIKASVIDDSETPNTTDNGLPWVTLDGDYDAIDNGGSNVSFAGGWKPFLNTNYATGLTRTNATGESVAITTNSSGYPVVFYMDANTGCPRIATASSASPTATDNWRVQGVFASTDENYNTASDYMSCVVDSQGYLHIAFQNTKGQLVYAKSTNNPSNGTTAYTFGSSQVLDDSGMWIDMTMNGTTPYISYLSRVNSYDGMKIAFFDSTFDADNDGVADTFDYDDDGEIDATGGWETLTAAMDAKVTNVRTCIEPNAKANDGTAYTAAIGFCPGLDYRAAFYVGQ